MNDGVRKTEDMKKLKITHPTTARNAGPGARRPTVPILIHLSLVHTSVPFRGVQDRLGSVFHDCSVVARMALVRELGYIATEDSIWVLFSRDLEESTFRIQGR
jgi:hypothetical protein